jgi:threonine/homoserine/homoserine lactone efflux protein
MDLPVYVAFMAVSAAFIVLPGPNIVVIVSTGLTRGRARALQTVAGTSAAMAIQLALVAVGTSWFVQRISDGFTVLKWLGATWLVLLALNHFRRSLRADKDDGHVAAVTSFITGFITSLTNPKTILFFSAFLPQFVVPTHGYAYQITVLSVSFLLLAIVIDSTYAVASARVWQRLDRARSPALHHRFSAALYLIAGTWLAMLRRVP